MSFTFTDNGTSPIAVIHEGKNERYVYLSDGEASPALEESSIVDEKLNEDSIQQIANSFRRGTTFREMYNLLLQSSYAPEPESFVDIQDLPYGPTEDIEVLPSPEPERVFIAGLSGCGKSTIAAKYAKQYLKMYPENKVFTFLRQEDPVYEDIPRQEICFSPPDDPSLLKEWQEDLANLLSGSIDLDQLEDSLVIFDDCDNIQDKKQLQAVHKLMNDVATNGRKRNIYCIYISHLLMNYAQTRVMLNEANKVFFFPQCGTRQIETFLKTYGGMKTKQAEAIANIKSRWVMLSMRFPRYIIHAKGMFML